MRAATCDRRVTHSAIFLRHEKKKENIKPSCWCSYLSELLLLVSEPDMTYNTADTGPSNQVFCLVPDKYRPQALFSRSQWPCGLRLRSSAARLLRLWVRIPPGAWMFVVSVVCCQVEVSATDWSHVQRSPTDCGASLCVIKKSRKRGG